MSFLSLASSSFDSGDDGWTYDAAGTSWQASGGDPDGYLRYNNNGDQAIFAPEDYLGNWSSLDEAAEA